MKRDRILVIVLMVFLVTGVLLISVSVAVPLAMLGPTTTSSAWIPEAPSTTTVTRAYQPEYGDYTDEINDMLARAQPGSTVTLGPGIYEIDATKSVQLRSGVTLELHRDAVLKAKANDQAWSAVVMGLGIEDATITGGTVVGERGSHTGNIGEWGMGIAIVNSKNISIKNLTVRDCWGDGLYVSWHFAGRHYDNCASVTIDNIIVDSNRRNGITVGGLIGGSITNSTIARNGGTNPGCGLDVEAATGWTEGRIENLVVQDCIAEENQKAGFTAYFYQNYGTTWERLTSRNNGEQGFVADGDYMTLVDCVEEGNGRTGLVVRGNHIVVTGGSYSEVKVSTGKFQPSGNDIMIDTTVDGNPYRLTQD